MFSVIGNIEFLTLKYFPFKLKEKVVKRWIISIYKYVYFWTDYTIFIQFYEVVPVLGYR